QGITLGPDHKIWFTEQNANKIGVFDPSTHTIIELTSPTALSQPFGIALDPVDNNLWYTELGTNKVGVVDAVTHTVNDYIVGSGTLGLGAVAFNPVTKNIDFLETQAKKVASFNPKTHTTVAEVVGVLDNSSANHIAVDAVGNDWFTERVSDSIGELTRATGKIN